MAGKKVRGANRGIHRRNLIHYIVSPYTETFFFNFYGKVEVTGRENIPRGEPVIFAPNHQNALMDALITLFKSPQDVVFLARADLFKARFLTFILNSLKILPVFRQRDGASELGKNEEVFDVSVGVLKKRHHLCVMPEGNHGHQRKLRAFGKGIFRIAISAQEDHGSKPFVKIVPVGLDFGDYIKQNTSLLVHYGKPIEISDYWDQLEENKPRAINAMKKRLIEDMKPGMIHIESNDYYQEIQDVRGIFNDRMREIMEIDGTKLSDRFRADKEMIARVETQIEQAGEDRSKIDAWSSRVKDYMAGLKQMNIRNWVVRDGGYGPVRSLWRYLSLILTFPFFLYGFITNALPYHLPVRLVRGIKDRQFHSSVKVGLALFVTFPLYYLIMTLLVGFLVPGPWWIWLVFLASLLPAGKLALLWYFRWKKTVRGSWFGRELRKGDAEAQRMTELRKEIIELTEEFVKS